MHILFHPALISMAIILVITFACEIKSREYYRRGLRRWKRGVRQDIPPIRPLYVIAILEDNAGRRSQVILSTRMSGEGQKWSYGILHMPGCDVPNVGDTVQFAKQVDGSLKMYLCGHVTWPDTPAFWRSGAAQVSQEG